MARDEMAAAVDAAARALVAARHAVALVGAGMSVESGIPPFRGPGGLWTRYGEPDMRGYQRFLEDPKAWWEGRLKEEGYRVEFRQALDQAQPNPGHYALAELERVGIVQYIITQNVDNLHQMAGSQRVAEIHGNRTKLRCIACGARFGQDEFPIKELPPCCPHCRGIVKTDGVMFGEPIPADVLEVCQREGYLCDCMLLLGTSGTVYPAAGFATAVGGRGGRLIEVNPYETHLTPACHIVLRMTTAQALPRIAERIKTLRDTG